MDYREVFTDPGINLFSWALYLLSWFLLSLGLYLLSKKLKGKKRWRAWIPGLRFAALGDSLDMDGEGVVYGLLEVVVLVASFLNLNAMTERVSDAMVLVILVLKVTMLVFGIRLFLRLTLVFGLRRRWLWLWLLAKWLPVMIIASGKKYQPREDLKLGDDWKAGLAPADLSAAGHRQELSDSGLSVDLNERTVRDFGRKRYLLKDISLDIPNGSLVLLLGGSGSGKTTFINAVIGYEKADARVMLNGADIYKDYDRVKYRIGLVPQQNLIRGSDTVIRTVTDAAELRLPKDLPNRERNKKVAEVLDLLGLAAGCNGLVSKKSGGQLRRISIAMELVTDPELFVLDEPDSGLDGVIARELFTKLRAIADEGKIVIAITHTPDRVIDLFDKVIVLARDSGRVGRLAFYGSPQEAREFFGKDTMEGVVMSINRREEGGDGMADEFIRRYAERTAQKEAEAAS